MTAPDLVGRFALVTGAGQGIGAAIARGLAEAGATVAVTDRQLFNAETEAASIRADYGEARAFALRLDVTTESDWIAAIEQCRMRTGALDILVNNAGIVTTGTVEDLDLAQWRQAMAVNADGPFLGCKHALPLMRESDRGAIVNIASVSSIIASHNLCAYNASKAALAMLTKSIALHCARQGWNIRCNSIHPAFVRTGLLDGFVGDRDPEEILAKLARQVPTGRIAEVGDVVKAVLYLASDDSSMMTASELKLDGGLSAQ